jgi:probable HAF family extracellular repeat protein
MTMKRYLCSLVALGVLQGVTGQVKAQPTYIFTTLDVPGSSYTSASAPGINAAGQIVGSFGLLDHGTYTRLDVPGSRGTSAFGINTAGQIVGYYIDAAYNRHGFLLENGSYTTLDAPGSRYTFAFVVLGVLAFLLQSDGSGTARWVCGRREGPTYVQFHHD